MLLINTTRGSTRTGSGCRDPPQSVVGPWTLQRPTLHDTTLPNPSPDGPISAQKRKLGSTGAKLDCGFAGHDGAIRVLYHRQAIPRKRHWAGGLRASGRDRACYHVYHFITLA